MKTLSHQRAQHSLQMLSPLLYRISEVRDFATQAFALGISERQQALPALLPADGKEQSSTAVVLTRNSAIAFHACLSVRVRNYYPQCAKSLYSLCCWD